MKPSQKVDFKRNLIYNGPMNKEPTLNPNDTGQLKEISLRLKQLRKEKGLNQDQVAKMLDITRAAYGKIETGVNEVNVRHLLKLSGYYDVSLDWLITGKGAKEETRRFGKHSIDVKQMLNDMADSKTYLHGMLSHYYSFKEKPIDKKNNWRG
jgi:transcriptional regulator with XRE-family HTH domain